MDTLGKRLTHAIQSAGIDHTALAAKLQYKERQVYRWLNDEATPRDRALKDLADVLGVRLDWLKTGRGEMVSRNGQRTRLQTPSELIDKDNRELFRESVDPANVPQLASDHHFLALTFQGQTVLRISFSVTGLGEPIELEIDSHVEPARGT